MAKLTTALIEELQKKKHTNKVERYDRGELESEISNQLEKWDPLWRVGVIIDKNKDSSESQEAWTIHLKWREKEQTMQHGDGVQHAALFALLKIWSQNDIFKTRSMVFLIEEPELFLHPQAQRVLKNELNNLIADTPSCRQIFMCSHSPIFIDLADYRSILMIYNDRYKGKIICQCKNELFAGDQKKMFNMTYWINPDRGELFFSKKVLLVEGITDKRVIPFLAQKLGIFRADFTVIDCGGKGGISNYIKLLNAFSIPYIAVYDKDHQLYKDLTKQNTADNDSQAIEDIINRTIGESIVFENDIEEEIGYAIANKSDKPEPHEVFDKINKPTYSIPTALSDKIRRMYYNRIG